ncbi:MAG: hypothetical protein KGZ86_04485 [Candidatus Latescibacteria bacterium]|nr:hypothetical protein [Candidatus Latescibacterota bacterium]
MTTKKTKKASSTKKKQYRCKICDLLVTAENFCGCRKECEIICCGKVMTPVK